MIALFKNRLAYLSVSLVLMMAAFPLISIGTTTEHRLLWWSGLLALTCGGLIPPLQRLLLGPPRSAPSPASELVDAAPTTIIKRKNP
ncbi:hypothetical protein H0A66_00700 [Alcaligenaceae bacterium]|nr:hypothetical protein [Alcaligenaceae bacterium]